MSSPRLKRTIKHLKSANSMKEAMLKAGFSAAYAHNPHLLKATRAYNREMAKELDKIETERNKILDEMNSRELSKEEYKVLSGVFAELTKTKQLLEGKPTEITQSSVANMTEAELERLADEQSSKEGASEEGAGEAETS